MDSAASVTCTASCNTSQRWITMWRVKMQLCFKLWHYSQYLYTSPLKFTIATDCWQRSVKIKFNVSITMFKGQVFSLVGLLTSFIVLTHLIYYNQHSNRMHIILQHRFCCKVLHAEINQNEIQAIYWLVFQFNEFGPKFTDDLMTILRQFLDSRQSYDSYQIHKIFMTIFGHILWQNLMITS